MTLTAKLTRPALLAALLLAAPLAGCATHADGDTYSRELARLSEDCRARGGILTPNTAQSTGAPERDFACKIN